MIIDTQIVIKSPGIDPRNYFLRVANSEIGIANMSVKTNLFCKMSESGLTIINIP